MSLFFKMTTLTRPHPAINFLIETGTLLHFPDTSHGLRTLYFLCPVWLSECLERIMHLKSSRSLARNGVIRAEDLRVSWDLWVATCARVSAIVADFLSWRVPHRCCWSVPVSPIKLRSSTSSSLPSLRLRSLWPTTGQFLALVALFLWTNRKCVLCVECNVLLESSASHCGLSFLPSGWSFILSHIPLANIEITIFGNTGQSVWLLLCSPIFI